MVLELVATMWSLVPMELTLFNVLSYFSIYLVFYVAYWYLSAPRGLPPGPSGLPVVGYFPFLGKTPHLKFKELGKKYGSVFSFYLGKQLTVVLNDYDAIKEAFVYQKDNFSGRPSITNLNLKAYDNLSIGTTNGSFWNEHRKFAAAFINDLGINKKSLESLILKEIERLLKELEKSAKQPTDVRGILGMSISNTVCMLATGKQFDYDDTWLLNLNQVMNQLVKTSNIFSARIFFPWLKYIPGTGIFTRHGDTVNAFETFEAAMEQIVDEKKESHVTGQRNDYLSAYLTERLSRGKKDDKDLELFSDKALIHNLRGLLGAGTVPLANTLMWCIIYMMENPDTQKKIQKELDDVFEYGRVPSWSDHVNTPFTEATLLEIQRLVSLTPLNLPHKNMEATQLLGYKIPKNSYVISNLWNVHHDPELWKNPEEFQPQRFLTESGDVYRPEYLIPFSTGKRQCLGKPMAEMELYLYFASLLQRFSFEAPKDSKLAPMDSVFGIHFVPTMITTCAIPRK